MKREVLSLLGLLLSACGAPQGASLCGELDGGAVPDAGNDFRAYTPAYPRVTTLGGALITAPRSRAYLADTDPLKAQLTAFMGEVLQSDWWAGATGEYCASSGPCIGPGTFDGVFALPAASGAVFSEADIKAVVAADMSNSAMPAPDAQSIYAFFVPVAAFKDPFGNSSCGFHAYHYYVSLPGRDGLPVRVPYLVTLRCSDSVTLQSQTWLASHELVEAATNPFMDALVVDDRGWAMTHGAELADVCLYAGTTTAGPWDVERVYSDRRAARGLDPCGLDADGVDFNTVPKGSRTTVMLRPGESTTLELIGESDGPTAADWDLQTYSLQPGVTLTLDAPTAHNGATVRLTIKVANNVPTAFAAPFIIRSKLGGAIHAWQGSVQSLY